MSILDVRRTGNPASDRNPSIPSEPFVSFATRYLDDESLSPMERLLLLALSRYEWKAGDGCWPSNATLARNMGIKSPRPIQKLLKELGKPERGYVRVVTFKATKENPTGRIVHLLPRSSRAIPPSHETPLSAGSPPSDETPTPRPTRRPPHVQPDARIDAVNSPENRSSGDDLGVVEAKSGGKPTATLDLESDAVKAQIPRWLAALARRHNPRSVLEAIFDRVGKMKSRPNDLVKYLGRCVEHEADRVESKPKPAVAQPPPATDLVAGYKADRATGEASVAEMMARWQATPQATREAIKRSFSEHKPDLVRGFPGESFLVAFYLEELDRNPAFREHVAA